MEAKEFARGYRERDTYIERRNPVPEIASLTEGPRYWSSFFSEQLLLSLEEENTLSPEEASRYLIDYSAHWSYPELKAITNQARHIATSNPDAQPFVNELNFHTMSSAMIPLWFKFLARDPEPLSERELTNIQTDLAMQSTDIIFERLKTEAKDNKNPEQRSGMVQVYNGQLTEIDAAIVFIEIMKQDESNALMILPAPPLFESSPRQRERNSDLIFIDRELREARGIQVKSHYDKRDGDRSRSYSRQFVTVIDGMNDLGNTKSVGRNFQSAPNPGLISMDHLQQVSLKDAQQTFLRHAPKEIIRAKSIARELSRNRKSFIPQAAEQVRAKAYNGIYQGFPGYPA